MRLHFAAMVVLLTGLAAPAVESQQASSAYVVELVIFRAGTALGGAENWSAETSSASSGADAAADDTQLAQLLGTVPESQYQLTGIANKLKSTGMYVPVAHVAWTQTASAWGKHAGLPVDKLGLNVEGLTGSVTLERGQYLHLGLALSYAIPNPPAGIGAAPGTAFTLNENRRVKFYERNYYDHPAFGVIALVTPAKDSRPAGR